MLDVIGALSGCAGTLRDMLSIAVKVMRFVSDHLMMMLGILEGYACLRSSLAFLEKAWVERSTCKHNGVVLPPVAASVGRGADGSDG